jgi:hypothetical protein
MRICRGEIPGLRDLRDPGRGVNCRSATLHYRKFSRFPRNGSGEVMLA